MGTRIAPSGRGSSEYGTHGVQAAPTPAAVQRPPRLKIIRGAIRGAKSGRTVRPRTPRDAAAERLLLVDGIVGGNLLLPEPCVAGSIPAGGTPLNQRKLPLNPRPAAAR